MQIYIIFIIGVILLTGGIYVKNVLEYDSVALTIGDIKKDFPGIAYIPTSLVMGIIKTESDFDAGAEGKAGEFGLVQMMPQNFPWLWKLYKVDTNAFPADNYFNPYTNILASMLLLDWLFRKLNGNTVSVLHSYNEGFTNFTRGKRVFPYVNKVLDNQSRFVGYV